MSGRSCMNYAVKRIVATKSWRNNILTVSTLSSSARFSASIGVSNTVTKVWTKVKNWFSGLFNIEIGDNMGHYTVIWLFTTMSLMGGSKCYINQKSYQRCRNS